MADIENVTAPVSRLTLMFRPKYIVEFERKHGPIKKVLTQSETDDNGNIILDAEGKPVFKIPSLEQYIDFVVAGNKGCDFDTAADIYGDWLADGGDEYEAYAQVVESLDKYGFFLRALKMGQKTRVAINSMKEAASKKDLVLPTETHN